MQLSLLDSVSKLASGNEIFARSDLNEDEQPEHSNETISTVIKTLFVILIIFISPQVSGTF